MGLSNTVHSSPSIAVAVMGPTASGKSAAAMELASVLDGEIVSADSMQLYRGLDVGTAKPSAEDRRRVPHHLLDVLDVSERSDVFRYCEMAEGALSQIRSRGRTPVIAGGTGLYLRALIYGLDPLPADPALRAELDEEYDSAEGFERLKLLMERMDPPDFKLWAGHRRKLIRALEVFKLSGSPMSSLQRAWKSRPPRKDMVCVLLSWDREALKERIRVRCDAMLSAGWIEEAREMIGRGLLTSPTARQALGYAAIAEHLEGRLAFDRLRESVALSTWQFARRQSTWFRNQHPEAVEIKMPAGEGEALDTVRRLILEKARRQS